MRYTKGIEQFSVLTLNLFFIADAASRNYWPGSKWPEAVVRYSVDRSLTGNDRAVVEDAFQEIESKTCIRFRPRRQRDRAFTNIQVDDSVCVQADMCRTGGEQYAKIGGNCRNMSMMIHALGHTLCLGNEEKRKDRDNYLNFDGCSANQVPEKDAQSETLGQLYDYASQMHATCGNCRGGQPKQPWVPGCGPQVTTGLSVLDVDKLNDFYDCGGCMGHRWRPIDTLTDEDLRNIVPFGRTESNELLYMCRVDIDGEVSIGKFFKDRGLCGVPFGGREHWYRGKAQVFTVLGGELGNGNSYGLFKRGEAVGNPIPCGRGNDGMPYYCGFADLEHDGIWEYNVPGKIYASNPNAAFFPFYGERMVGNYRILRCEVEFD